jgi:hypothetical protein
MLARCGGRSARLHRLLGGVSRGLVGGGAPPAAAAAAAAAGQRAAYGGVVQSLAKAAVNQALDRAILKDRLGAPSGAAASAAATSGGVAVVDAAAAAGLVDDGMSADVETWRAIVDQPLVRTADSVELKDLLLISNDT